MKRILTYLFLFLNLVNANNYYQPELDNGPNNCCKHQASWDDPFTLMCETCAYDTLGFLNKGKIYKYYKNNNVAYKISCKSTSVNSVNCNGKNNENGGTPQYTAICADHCLSNYHLIPEVDNLWIYDTNHPGKRPDCPIAIMPRASNKNYRYSTVDVCKKLCINEPTGMCNIISRYGVGIKQDTDQWHCWYYACPDPFRFEWIPQNSWGHYASSCNTYILPIRHYNIDQLNFSPSPQSITQINYINKTRYINKTIYINKTNYIPKIIYTYNNVTNYIDTIRYFNKTIYHYKNKTITIYKNQTIYNIINKDIYNIINITNIFNKTNIYNKTNVIELIMWREKINWTNKTQYINKTLYVNKTRYETIHVYIQEKNNTASNSTLNLNKNVNCDESTPQPIHSEISFDMAINKSSSDSSTKQNLTSNTNLIFTIGFFVLSICVIALAGYFFWHCWCKENCQEIEYFCCSDDNKNNNTRDLEIPTAYPPTFHGMVPPLVTATSIDSPNPFHNKKIDTIIEKGSKVTEETVTSPGGTVIRRRTIHV